MTDVASTQEAVERVVSALVEEPEHVEVRDVGGRNRCNLELRVAPRDMGAVIGRGGRTAGALRSLLRARGDSHGETYDLKIREQGEP